QHQRLDLGYLVLLRRHARAAERQPARELRRPVRVLQLLSMNSPVALWHTEHVYFRRLLGLLQVELDAFHRGERPNYELMLDIVAYLREYSDAFHHPCEDVAFQ